MFRQKKGELQENDRVTSKGHRDLPEGFSLAKSGHFEHQDNYRLLKDDNPRVHSSTEYK